MNPHTLCLIQPDANALPEEREQLSGLIVTTLHRTEGDCWDVAPAPRVTYSSPVLAACGTSIVLAGATVGVLIPAEWLRPIEGLPQVVEVLETSAS
jgi:hypothetical protein